MICQTIDNTLISKADISSYGRGSRISNRLYVQFVQKHDLGKYKPSAMACDSDKIFAAVKLMRAHLLM